MSQSVIPPIVKTETQNWDSFYVEVISITFSESATLAVKLYNADLKYVNSQIMYMIGEDYANWKGDDTYVFRWVNEQLHKTSG